MFGFEVKKKIQETEKILRTAAMSDRCGLGKIKDYVRAASATAAAAAASARCVCSMLYVSRAKAVNRRHRGAMGSAMCSVCVGRAVRCACVPPEPTAR